MIKSKIHIKDQKDDGVVLINNLVQNKEYFVGDREKKTFLIFLTGEKDQSGEVKIIIKGKNARVQILGIIIGFGKGKINLYTLQDHKREESVSDLYIKSTLFDEAKFYYSGLIKIEKNAQKSNAYQKNQNILLSPYSWAESKPYLEILANDVRCTHGATIGKIDKEQLYYLATRGLTENQATQLILEGFYQDILHRIPDEQIKRELGEKVKKKIQLLLSGRTN